MPINKNEPIPPQHQNHQPGFETEMDPPPQFDNPEYKGSGKLLDKVALITGGDSGIGRAVAIAFAKEGADVVVSYLCEHEDAEETKQLVQGYGRECITIAGDVSDASFCKKLIAQSITKFNKIDTLINNAAVQFPHDSLEKIEFEQLEHTFRVNIFSMFYLTKPALKYLKSGSTIINTSSITAYRGSARLIDYSSTKGAIVSFTRSLSQSLVSKGIRVNAVAPGPIWTPLIPASFNANEVSEFGENVPMKRAGQPEEVAACYVFLASSDSSYMTGQVLHPNGGVVING